MGLSKIAENAFADVDCDGKGEVTEIGRCRAKNDESFTSAATYQNSNMTRSVLIVTYRLL